MDSETSTFCEMIRNRSAENRRAMSLLSVPHEVLSPAFSILRQELDSMVRVIFLLAITNLAERERLIRSTLQGDKWKVATPKGKFRSVTDRDMVELGQKLQHWTQSVYNFGCAFTHLSDYHNHLSKNPFENLSELEKQHVLKHMRYYHDGPSHDSPDMRELSRYLPNIFDKINSNLECYLKQLERNEILDIPEL